MKSWLDIKDIQQLVPDMSREAARKLIKDIHYEMEQEGAYLFTCKKLIAPKTRVYKKLEIRKWKEHKWKLQLKNNGLKPEQKE